MPGRSGDRGRVREELLAEIVARQPLLAVLHAITAFLFASALTGAAPAPLLALWLGYMGLVQAVRLFLWYLQVRGRLSIDPGVWLAATSGAAGIAWGSIGVLFADLGSPAQQMLVPFFLAGMSAGGLANLAGNPPVIYAFMLPTLLPYAAHLALTGGPGTRAMALTTLAYTASLSAVAHQVHRSYRRSIELHLENARLVADLEQAQRGLERLVERRGAELDAVMETVPVAVWLAHDPEARWITASRCARDIFSLPSGSNASHAFRILRDGVEVGHEDLPLQRAARGSPVNGEELRVVSEDGSSVDMLVSAATVRDAAGNPAGAVGAGVDITERKRVEERIRHLAQHDQLTGLPNRGLLQDRLRQALALTPHGGSCIGLLLLDIDCFKDVNDTLGHPAGDWLLRAVAERLGAAIRHGDTLARLGGDEFAVLQPALDGPGCAAALAQRLIETLAPPFRLEAQEVHVSASVGVALSPHHSNYADGLVRKADLALYRAKRDGRGRFRLFEPVMDAEVQARHRLDRELRRALDGSEFILHYQPQVSLAADRVEGVEALVRWRHPERGLVPPGEFIPAAEASGLIRPLGAWVLSEACRQARAWRDAGLDLVMAVNLSPAQLRYDGMLSEVDGALRASGLDPRCLELEITESLLLERSEGATDHVLRGLAARGVRLAFDDFGTGYSSLASLKRLPVEKIKIDRSFVRDIGRDPEGEAVVRAMVSLGRALGKRVVAEGVENEAQLAFLRRLGCDAAQGFMLAGPAAALEIGPLLAHLGSPPLPAALHSAGYSLKRNAFDTNCAGF